MTANGNVDDMSPKYRWGFLLSFIVLLILFVGSASAEMEPLNEKEMQNVSAMEGVFLDFGLNITLDSAFIEDSDGESFSPGTLQLGSGSDGIQIDDGSGRVAELKGLTVDVDGSNFINFGLPEGRFSVEVDRVYLGDPSSESSLAIDASGIYAGEANLGVKPN